MASAIASKLGKSMLAKHIASIEPEDPVYEETTDERGKKKRTRRLAPEGLSQRDQKLLAKVKRRARRLDKGMSLCGFRVGYTFFIGLIPGVGDIVDASLNYFLVIRPIKKAEVPQWLVSQMLVNNAISAGVGMIPFVGDVFLGVWKANSRNAHAFEEYLAIRGAEYLAAQGFPVSASAGHAELAPTSKANPDVVQSEYKPGAGIIPGEVILPRNQQGAQGQGRGFFGRMTGGGVAQHPQQAPVQAAPAVRNGTAAKAPALPARH